MAYITKAALAPANKIRVVSHRGGESSQAFNRASTPSWVFPARPTLYSTTKPYQNFDTLTPRVWFFKGERSPFSNLHDCSSCSNCQALGCTPFRIRGFDFTSAEKAYQFVKARAQGPKYFYISLFLKKPQTSPRSAMNTGKRVELTSTEWLSGKAKVQVMREVLEQKVQHCKCFRGELLDFHSGELREGTQHRLFGGYPNCKNELGKIIMDLKRSIEAPVPTPNVAAGTSGSTSSNNASFGSSSPNSQSGVRWCTQVAPEHEIWANEAVTFKGDTSVFDPEHQGSFCIRGRTWPNVTAFFSYCKAVWNNQIPVAVRILKEPHRAQELDHLIFQGEPTIGSHECYPEMVWYKTTAVTTLYLAYLAKTAQNARSKRRLKATKNRLLGYGLVEPTAMATGLAMHHKNTTDPSLWLGDNAVGKSLMRVRAHLLYSPDSPKLLKWATDGFPPLSVDYESTLEMEVLNRFIDNFCYVRTSFVLPPPPQ